jgi:hypothetical protein
MIKDSVVKIKILTVVFDLEIERRDIPAFRGAIIEKVGRENILFHNHFEGTFRYGYPLIQYKVFRKNPAIICVNEGTEEILKFFEQTNWDIHLKGQAIRTEIKFINLDYFSCSMADREMRYRIYNWFALNEDNFQKFTRLAEENARTKFLEGILIGNILSFAKGVGWRIDRKIELRIPRIPKGRLFSFKDHQMVGFDLEFGANIVLPENIGLGKSVARGLGLIRKGK